MGYLDVNGLSYLYSKLKTKFALASHDHNVATTAANGFMSSGDKTKLNGIATGATKNSITTNTATLTVAGWSNKSQTVSVSGVTTTNLILVTTNDVANGIKCTAQGSGTLTFTCESVPTSNVTVSVAELS